MKTELIQPPLQGPARFNWAKLDPPRRVYGAYCGAPPGIRCRCGAQLAGHDPGDEDTPR